MVMKVEEKIIRLFFILKNNITCTVHYVCMYVLHECIIYAIYFMCVNMYLGVPWYVPWYMYLHTYWFVAHVHLVAWLFLVFKIRGVHTHVYFLGTFGLSQKLFSESAIETVLRLSGVLGYLGTSLSI